LIFRLKKELIHTNEHIRKKQNQKSYIYIYIYIYEYNKFSTSKGQYLFKDLYHSCVDSLIEKDNLPKQLYKRNSFFYIYENTPTIYFVKK